MARVSVASIEPEAVQGLDAGAYGPLLGGIVADHPLGAPAPKMDADSYGAWKPFPGSGRRRAADPSCGR